VDIEVDALHLFDLEERYAAFSKAGDPLERLAAVVDFEVFRAELDAALRRSDRAKGGRPPIDPVLMFKFSRVSGREGGFLEVSSYLSLGTIQIEQCFAFGALSEKIARVVRAFLFDQEV
jgi:hypothetical protein